MTKKHAKFSACFNVDSGTGEIRGIYLQGIDRVRPVFQQWLAPFRDMDATTLSFRETGGTDHLSFGDVGLPAYQFIRDRVEYETRTHHSNTDGYDRASGGLDPGIDDRRNVRVPGSQPRRTPS